MNTVLCVGSALIDTFLSVPEESMHLRADENTRELSFRLGDKIELESAAFLLGGNACNVSVGVSRLGNEAYLMAEVGDDEFAQKILRDLSEERVSTAHIRQTDTQSSFAMGINYAGDRTLFIKHTKREHKFSFPERALSYIYLTSMGNVWEETYTKTVHYARSYQVPIACNPGTLQLKAGLTELQPILAAVTILFLNTSEAQKLLTTEAAPKELLEMLQKLGPKIVVITDGDNGSFARDTSGKTYHLGISKRDVIERTGAGDAYASGFLGSILHGESVANAMQWGTLNAAGVIGKVGAQPGLLSYNEMAMQLKTYKDELKVEEV